MTDLSPALQEMIADLTRDGFASKEFPHSDVAKKRAEQLRAAGYAPRVDGRWIHLAQ